MTENIVRPPVLEFGVRRSSSTTRSFKNSSSSSVQRRNENNSTTSNTSQKFSLDNSFGDSTNSIVSDSTNSNNVTNTQHVYNGTNPPRRPSNRPTGYQGRSNGFNSSRSDPRKYISSENKNIDESQESQQSSVSQNEFMEENIDISDKKIVSMVDLRKKHVQDLGEIADMYNISDSNRLSKQDLITTILRQAGAKGEVIYGEGVLEIATDGFGFLRYSDNNYAPCSDNIYVSQNQIKKFSLRTGDLICGYAREPRRGEKFFSLLRILSINGHEVGAGKRIINFDDMTPVFPSKKLDLDVVIGPKRDVSTRVIDLIAPIAKGQRSLLVAPPRSGKTLLMKNIAYAINQNHPEVHLIVLLIDERPEEVTDMIGSVKGEVLSSTFDEAPERHVALTEIVIARAKRMVEEGKDVIILLDSITRLARACNIVTPPSGRVLTGGMDANALQKPKRFFGAARSFREHGSLTIIATALVETGSKMDELIFEEFKGRGNHEIPLDRKLADKRIFPAIAFDRAGTRNEEEMVDPDTLSKMWALRRILSNMNDQFSNTGEALEFLLRELKKTDNNAEFFTRMNN